MKLTNSYVHVGSEKPLIGATIDEYFRFIADKYPEDEAIVSIPENVRLTYREFAERVDRLARGLLTIGVQLGDRVGIWSTNNVTWLLLQFATARVGAVLVNINPAYRRDELAHALKKARVQTLFLIPEFRTSKYAEMTIDLVPELTVAEPGNLASREFPDLSRVVAFTQEGQSEVRPARGFTKLSEVLARAEEVYDEELLDRATDVGFDDPVNIQFTSGTTGAPKGVVLTHHNVLNNGFFVAEGMRLTHRDRLCVAVPFYHCFGMVISTLGCVTHGATIVIPSEYFDAASVLDAVERERCTVLHGVPTMFSAELEVQKTRKTDLSSLRTGIMAGAPCPPLLMRKVIGDLGIRELLIAYGQTEASPATHQTHPDDSFSRRVNSVGVNLPHQESKIVDPESGRIVPVGTKGEVCFRGYHVMKGYFEDEEATRAQVDADGWLHSGDLGTMDENGYLSITGRLKDMIIRGGENIYPAEIENFYFKNPKVVQAAVFGIPDETMGEEVCMFVTLAEGESAGEDELRDFARGRIAHYKVPKHIFIVSEFPMTVTGKIQKFRMAELALEMLEDR
ncbi:MAG: AMP-binding protein [Planctomycetes bacterium]|nr:AMP-binding protein [Planctomycetota bacterium]